MKNLRTRYAAALFLTPAALLAACSTTSDTRTASARRDGPDYSSKGDSAESARHERDAALAGRTNPDAITTTQYDSRVNQPATARAANPGTTNTAAATNQTTVWGPNASGHWGPEQNRTTYSNYSSNPSANPDQVSWQAQQNNAAQNRTNVQGQNQNAGTMNANDRDRTNDPKGQNWANAPTNLKNENPSIDNSSSRYNTGVQRPTDPVAGTVNNQNTGTVGTPNWTREEQLAANRASTDPSTNPGNANAQQIGSDGAVPNSNKSGQNQAWSDRPASDVAGSGQNRVMDAAVANASPDSRILSVLHMKNQYEVEAGRLAQSRSSNSQVQQYGAMLVSAHTEADAKVVKVASQANAKLLSTDETRQLMSIEKGQNANMQKDPLAELRSLNGAEFDRVFAQKMVEGHAKLATMIEQAQPNVQNPQVRQLLVELLPVVREHEKAARNLPGFSESAVKSGTSGTPSMNK